MLARSTGRAREFAIRSALGAGRGRLLRQSLTESAVLGLLGGALGLLVAAWGTKLALGFLPTALPRAEEVRLDERVLLFALAISLLTGIVSGLAPALKTSRWRMTGALKEGGRGASSGRARAQGVFVAVQMSLALVLLIGAGLMIRSLTALWKVDPGFRPDNTLTFALNLSPAMGSATTDTVRAAFRDLSDKINATPGVVASSFSSGASPLQGEDDLFFWIDGQPKPASQSEMNMALIYRVDTGYLDAMGIPLKQGRFFTPQDDERATPVAVIDETFARQYFSNENPIGQRLHLGDDQPAQIVGVVAHVKQWSIASDETQSLQSQVYIPFRGLSDNNLPLGAGVVVRSSGSGSGPELFNALRRTVESQKRAERNFESADAEPGDCGNARATSLLDVSAWIIRGGGAVAGEPGHLRSCLVSRGPAHTGNRHPPGARCAAPRRVTAGVESRDEDGAERCSAGAAGGVRAYSFADEDVVRRQR
jgi:predicted permease